MLEAIDIKALNDKIKLYRKHENNTTPYYGIAIRKRDNLVKGHYLPRDYPLYPGEVFMVPVNGTVVKCCVKDKDLLLPDIEILLKNIKPDEEAVLVRGNNYRIKDNFKVISYKSSRGTYFGGIVVAEVKMN